MVMMTWLADALRGGGVKVVEVDGWQTRGRGEMGMVRGILCHHTGGSLHGDSPSLDLVLHGRTDLAGPLSQLVLGRDGTFHVLAAGRCNHAGNGEWQGITTGNSSFIGIEAENAGTPADPWPQVQMDAYVEGCAAILRHLGAPALMVAGHREYARPVGRKIDPLFDMTVFRTRVDTILKGAAVIASAHPPAIEPQTVMLKRGATGGSVKLLQTLLHLHTDGVFGDQTYAAVVAFQSAKGLTADGMVGPVTWKALGV